MDRIQNFRDLNAWKTAMTLVVEVYEIAHALPAAERYHLADQMRRAAVSVPSNVAEGQASGPGKRYLHHVRIAQGSLAELETQLEVCLRLGLVPTAVAAATAGQLSRVRQLLSGLNRSLRSQLHRTTARSER